jgi:hypothetical protein
MATLQPNGGRYWSLVEPVWLRLNRTWERGSAAFLRQYRTVRPEVGHLYAGHWCHCEVCNGGFFQFFWNTTGLLAPEAAAGFRAVGLPELAEILAEAMKFFGSPYPRDRGDRQDALPARQPRRLGEGDPFRPLDERFYEWSERWGDAADAYAHSVTA